MYHWSQSTMIPHQQLHQNSIIESPSTCLNLQSNSHWGSLVSTSREWWKQMFERLDLLLDWVYYVCAFITHGDFYTPQGLMPACHVKAHSTCSLILSTDHPNLTSSVFTTISQTHMRSTSWSWEEIGFHEWWDLIKPCTATVFGLDTTIRMTPDGSLAANGGQLRSQMLRGGLDATYTRGSQTWTTQSKETCFNMFHFDCCCSKLNENEMGWDQSFEMGCPSLRPFTMYSCPS